MDAKLYLKELKRLTNSCNMDCDDCRLYDKMACECQEGDEMWVDIVEQWAKDCPSETVLDVFRRHYPNFLKRESLTPMLCPNLLDERYSKLCVDFNKGDYECVQCWQQPAIIEPQNEPQKEPPIIESECHICKYTDKNPDEWPCRICSNNYTNEFRIGGK